MAEQSSRDFERTRRNAGSLRRAGAPSPRREGHSAARVDEFLTTALDLFAQRNFASVTIKDIAEHLGVNTALIYYYFDSKTDLFRATIEYAVARAFENVRALDNRSADPATIIAAWLENHVNKHAEIHRFVKIALDFRGAHEGDPDISNTIESFYVEERKLLSKVIREGIKQGLFKPVDPKRMGQFISTYLDGCMVRSVILTDFDLDGAVRDLHRRVLEMLEYTGKTQMKRRRHRKAG
jgi:TetR/AcrR family transcriptional regulator, upper aerobic nicotinate degradation pathway regulator